MSSSVIGSAEIAPLLLTVCLACAGGGEESLGPSPSSVDREFACSWRGRQVEGVRAAKIATKRRVGRDPEPREHLVGGKAAVLADGLLAEVERGDHHCSVGLQQLLGIPEEGGQGPDCVQLASQPAQDAGGEEEEANASARHVWSR